MAKKESTKKKQPTDLKIGSKAPNFKLFDQDMKEHNLKDYKGKKTILAFFPAALSPVCTKEMCAFRDSFEELKNAGAEILAISVDGPFANKQFATIHNLNFPVLSDYARKVIQKYNVVMPNLLHVKGYNAAKRSVFVLDSNGIIRYKWVSDNPLIEPNYEEVKNIIRQIN